MFEFNIDLDDTPPPPRSKAHQYKHAMFGIFVCTGMAHLVLTTFDISGISYIRVFIVGAIYVGLGLTVKMGKEKAVYCGAIIAVLSTVSSMVEVLISGSHFLATMLTVFDVISIFFVLNYVRVKDLPFPLGDVKDDKSSNNADESVVIAG